MRQACPGLLVEGVDRFQMYLSIEYTIIREESSSGVNVVWKVVNEDQE